MNVGLIHKYFKKISIYKHVILKQCLSFAQTKPLPVPSLHVNRIRNKKSRSGLIKAFATADSYDLDNLYNIYLNDCNYSIKITPEEVGNVLNLQLNTNENHANSIFIFKDGVSVFWDIKDPEVKINMASKLGRLSIFIQLVNEEGDFIIQTLNIVEIIQRSASSIKQILKTLKSNSKNPYQPDLVDEECDSLDFSFHEQNTTFQNGKIYLQPKNLDLLELYTFSNSLAQSVKLSIWESFLNTYAQNLERIVEDMQTHSIIKIKERTVLQKAGQLFKLRHQINLTSDFLDPPDFYWDHERLESLFIKTSNYLCINRRTKIMNEKLNHCFEIINLLQNYLNDKRHIRLEWMIIALIMVEVLMGLFSTYQSFDQNNERLRKINDRGKKLT